MLALYFSILGTEDDRAYFETLYRQYYTDIARRIRGILRDEEDTKDVMQETWMRVISYLGTIRAMNERTARAYILRIAKNQAISLIRKQKREEGHLSEDEILDIADERELFAVCESSGFSGVLACFGALNEVQRDVLILHYLHGHSAREIAKLLGISEHAAESRLTRGRLKLIGLLKERGYRP